MPYFPPPPTHLQLVPPLRLGRQLLQQLVQARVLLPDQALVLSEGFCVLFRVAVGLHYGEALD